MNKWRPLACWLWYTERYGTGVVVTRFRNADEIFSSLKFGGKRLLLHMPPNSPTYFCRMPAMKVSKMAFQRLVISHHPLQ